MFERNPRTFPSSIFLPRHCSSVSIITLCFESDDEPCLVLTNKGTPSCSFSGQIPCLVVSKSLGFPVSACSRRAPECHRFDARRQNGQPRGSRPLLASRRTTTTPRRTERKLLFGMGRSRGMEMPYQVPFKPNYLDYLGFYFHLLTSTRHLARS